jgi:hypothetical protein
MIPFEPDPDYAGEGKSERLVILPVFNPYFPNAEELCR